MYWSEKEVEFLTNNFNKMGNIELSKMLDRSIDSITGKLGLLGLKRPRSPHVIDEGGNNYGRLTVIEETGRSKYGIVLWKCKCNCGNVVIISGTDLRRGHTKSCGCYKEDLSRGHYGASNFTALWDFYKSNAKKRGLKFSLTKEDFSFITKMNCFYCGCKPASYLNRPRTFGEYVYNGIDRIDNTKGYILDNVAPCCSICNYMKRKLTLKKFKKHILRIVEHRKWQS